MERIAEYMALSKESWGGSQQSHGRQDCDNRPNDPTVENPQADTGSASSDNAYNLIEELFMTPESEDDDSDLEDLPTDDEEDGMDDNDEEPLSSPLSAFLLTATPSSPGSHVSDDVRSVLPSLSPTSSDATSNTPVWQWTTDDTFIEPPLDFTGEATFTEVPAGDDVELRFFLEFFTDEIVELIVQQSNLYFTEVTTRQERLSRRNRKFKKITKEDIFRMVATRICMGLDKKPTQANYWSNNPFYKSEIVPLIMTSDRYKEVMQFLHFCNNAEQVQGDRLHKIINIWELFNERLGLHCTPGKNICIDESLVSFKGNLSFRQYIPSKSAKMGIKLFGIGDSETGYILWAIIYEGKGHQFEYDAKEFGFGGAVALELAARYLHSGRCLYMDNYFINARIAKELLNLNTNICGTLRKRLKCNPIMTSKIKAGATEVYSCDGVMVERWKDKREVCMLSTGHEHYMTSVRTKGGKLKLKPQTVLEYNKYSRAIDKMDMVTGIVNRTSGTRSCSSKCLRFVYTTLIYCTANNMAPFQTWNLKKGLYSRSSESTGSTKSNVAGGVHGYHKGVTPRGTSWNAFQPLKRTQNLRGNAFIVVNKRDARHVSNALIVKSLSVTFHASKIIIPHNLHIVSLYI